MKAAVLAAAVLLLSACSQAPKTTENTSSSSDTTPAAPTGPVPAKTAFWEMYKPARQWATDLLPLTVVSKEIPGMKNEDGKAAMWQVTFASASRQEARTFTYAVAAHSPDIYKGVTIGNSLPWAGPTRQLIPFQISEYAVDSDAAFKTATTQAADWLKTHPGETATMTLQDTARFPGPVWYILWGSAKSGYQALVSASTGTALGK